MGRLRAFWTSYGALHQIEPSRSLIIGDFGLGSDAPIILDYRAALPAVMRLRWLGRGLQNEWVRIGTFDDFVEHLGLR